MTDQDLAQEIYRRSYPDVTACALLGLLRLADMRSKPGYLSFRHWGVGPHHRELANLGLVTIGRPEYRGGARPVDLTARGRRVAVHIHALRISKLEVTR